VANGQGNVAPPVNTQFFIECSLTPRRRAISLKRAMQLCSHLHGHHHHHAHRAMAAVSGAWA
jgi:hypothetical protein